MRATPAVNGPIFSVRRAFVTMTGPRHALRSSHYPFPKLSTPCQAVASLSRMCLSLLFLVGLRRGELALLSSSWSGAKASSAHKLPSSILVVELVSLAHPAGGDESRLVLTAHCEGLARYTKRHPGPILVMQPSIAAPLVAYTDETF